MIYKFQIFENTNSLIHFYLHAMKTSYRSQTFTDLFRNVTLKQQISNFEEVRENYTKYINQIIRLTFISLQLLHCELKFLVKVTTIEISASKLGITVRRQGISIKFQ